MPVANHLFSPCRGEVRDDAVGGDVVTRWTCPGCQPEIEARAIYARHRCPNRGPVDGFQTRRIRNRPGCRIRNPWRSETGQVAETAGGCQPEPRRHDRWVGSTGQPDDDRRPANRHGDGAPGCTRSRSTSTWRTSEQPGRSGRGRTCQGVTGRKAGSNHEARPGGPVASEPLIAQGCVSVTSARRGRLNATVGDVGVWQVRLAEVGGRVTCPATGTCRHIEATGKVAALPAGQRPRADW